MEDRFSHEADCSEDTYWRHVALDEDFNRRLFVDRLGFESWEVRRLDENDAEVRRIVQGIPKLDDRVPDAFRRFLRHGLAYRETDVFDKATNRCQVVVVPRSMSRRISVNILLETKPLGGERCEVLFHITVVATVAVALGGTSSSGIGRIIEKEIIERFMEGFIARGELTNEFLVEKGLSTKM